jgi:hypothetical protein
MYIGKIFQTAEANKSADSTTDWGSKDVDKSAENVLNVLNKQESIRQISWLYHVSRKGKETDR